MDKQVIIDKISSIKTNNAIIKHINSLVSYLRDTSYQEWHPDKLANIIGELSVLRINLGEMVAGAVFEYNYAYVFRKFKVASEYKTIRQHVKTNKDADEAALLNSKDEYDTEVAKQYQADTLKTYYDDIGTLVMSLQSILNHKSKERYANNRQT